MAIRARADNLSLELPSQSGAGRVRDFAEVWAHREALRQSCVRMIGDVARAEDLVQDTFVSALKCHGRLHEDQPVAPWLKTVARRRSIDELRGRDRVALMATVPDAATPVGDDPAEHVVSQELVDALRSAIAELTPRERQLLLRQASYGLTLAELAAEEHTSIASVRSVLARARHKLRGSLERGGVFGVLPLPRYLVTLRDRVARWGAQFEPALPVMTGAGSRIGEVVAAVVTAIAMLLTGGGSPPSYPDSLVTTGLASNSFDVPNGANGDRSGDGISAMGGLGGTGAGGGLTTPTTMRNMSPLPPLPPEIGDQPLPPDGSEDIDINTLHHFAATSDGSIVFAGGISSTGLGRGVLYRSDDGGASWRRLGSDKLEEVENSRTYPGGKFFLSPNFPADPTIYAVGNGALWRSVDAGESFAPIRFGVGKAIPSPYFGTTDKRFFVSGPPPGEYDVAKDEMRPMTLLPPTTSAADIVIGPDFDTTGEILLTAYKRTATGSYGVVYTCTPNGCTERTRLPGMSIIGLHVSSHAPGTVFAWDRWLYARSTDGGHTFVFEPVSEQTQVRGVHEIGSTLYRYGNDGAETEAPLYRSDDSGVTWTPLAGGSGLAKGISAMIALPNGRLIAGQHSLGVFCSTDGGATWATRCPPA